MSLARRLAVLFALLLFALPAAAVLREPWLSPRLTDHPLVGKVADAQGYTEAGPAMIKALESAKFVFLGEKHDNPDQHRFELWLIRLRLQAKAGSAVVFEMLDDSQASKLATLKADDSLEQMRAKLEWPEKSWDFAVYGPLFKAALEGGKLVPGNISKAFIGQVYADGDKALGKDPRFASVATAAKPVREHLLESIFEAHCQMQSRDTLAPMLSIQLAKDASMASAMSANAPAMLVAGGEHVRPDTGVPSHMQAGDRVVIQMIEVIEGETETEAYIKRAGPADFYIFSAATAQVAHCAEVKGRAAK
jgi:uncharacterized iron-regulated protein